MTPRFDPAGYPGPRPDGPAVVHRGEVRHVELGRTCDAPVVAAGDAPVLADDDVRWSVAYGANACPDRLVDKGLDRRGALLLPGRLAGWAPAFENRRTVYGSVPLTLVPDAGRCSDVWLLGLHPDDLEVLDRSEGRVPAHPPASAGHGGAAGVDGGARPPAGTYVLGRVGEVAVADRFRLPDALAYLPGPSARVQVLPDGRWRTHPEHDQGEARAHAGRGGPTAAASDPDEEVTGPWPATPLADLPLFAYGSLQPHGTAWHLVDDLVEVAGEASVEGRLHDPGHGWPAAVLDRSGAGGVSSRVHGLLLEPRSPAAAAELLDRADRYEGAPGLFRRVCVLAETAGGRRWTLAYTWAEPPAPGPEVPSGRW